MERREVRLGATGILTLLVLMGVFAAMQFAADRARRTATRLESLLAAVYQIDGLEWRIIHQRLILPETEKALEGARESITRDLSALQSIGGTAATAEIRAAFTAYDRAIRREIELVLGGRAEEAEEVDEQVVDPAAARLISVARAEGRRLTAEAERAGRLALVGSILTLIASMVVASWFVRRVESERQREAAVRRENLLLAETNLRLAEANQQLEEASRMKSVFLANTSHELRTPLTGIIGYLGLLRRDLAASPAERDDMLDQALGCSRSLLRIINDLLDMSRIEAGRMTLVDEPVRVEDVLESAGSTFAASMRGSPVQLHIEPPPPSLPPMRGDASRIQQVLANLVSNSIKFTSAGAITVRARLHPAATHVEFEVADTGIGIPRDRLEAIFEPFVQADAGITRSHGGSGIGLSIARSLTEVMGGILALESDGPGCGATARFSIPVWHEAPVASPPTGTVEGPAGAPLVLVVESDREFGTWAAEVLMHHGYRTVLSGDAGEGMRLALEARPALVLLDYALHAAPDAELRTGLDLAKALTSDPGTRSIPIVFLTGFDVELRAKLEGWAHQRKLAVLAKPFDGTALMREVLQVIAAPSPHTGPVRVLLADDDPAVATFVSHVLPAPEFVVATARDGAECLAALGARAGNVDVLLLDLMMPQMSGYDVLRAVTLGGAAPGVPVVVLTNVDRSRESDQSGLLRSGCVLRVLSKAEVHADPSVLREALEAVLGARASNTPAARKEAA